MAKEKKAIEETTVEPKAAPKVEDVKPAVDPHAGGKYRVKKSWGSPLQLHVVKGPIKSNLIKPGFCLPKDMDEKTVESLLKRGIIEEVK